MLKYQLIPTRTAREEAFWKCGQTDRLIEPQTDTLTDFNGHYSWALTNQKLPVWLCVCVVQLCVCVVQLSVCVLLCMCGCVYVWCSYEDSDSVEVTSRHIRPRARHKLCLADISVGSRVLVNYNYDEPNGRGYWYDAVVSGKHVTRTVKRLTATVFIG